jgi:predicted DCC family thiol-disulfide oxidoreductase YuxK
MMKCLYILFDAECALCQRCREWLMRQAAFVPLRFIPLQSPEIVRRFPGIAGLKPEEQLLAIGDNGAVYRGARAWIMCLWALQDYRLHAQRLAQPVLLPFARIFCELLSRNRYFISRQLFKEAPHRVARRLAAQVRPAPANCTSPDTLA